jgi:hypothetical protein
MKYRAVISCIILAVYSFVLAHSIIPHHHHTHPLEFINAVMDVLHDDHRHADGSTHDHDTPKFPHHKESQHPEVYRSTTNTYISQVFATLTLYCHAVQTFDLRPEVVDINQHDFYFVPLKIPIAFTASVPLRAPPVV